jgi:ectoine hydroxylase-related dioxygenase (phytanoyl-CoA dioxygenase family)
VACWIALDDVDGDNGTVLIGSEGKGDDATQVKQIVEALAGSVVFMSSRLAHKSTGNGSSHFRRAFMPQYASRPFLDRTSSLPLALAIPIHF